MNEPRPGCAIDKRRCRVCTRHNVDLAPFAEAQQQQQLPCALSEAIATVGAIQVEDGDELPQHCCVNCLRRVQEAYQLRKLCQHADRMLREMFSTGRYETGLVAEVVPTAAAVIKEEMDDSQLKLTNDFGIKVELPFEEEFKEPQLPLIQDVMSAAAFIKEEIDDSELILLQNSVPSEEVEEPQLNILKEEIDIDDDGDGNFDDDMDVDMHQKSLTQHCQNFCCMKCGKYFVLLSKLREHECRCEFCHAKDPGTQTMLQHIESHKMPDNTLKCLLCGRCYRSGQSLRHHNLKHKVKCSEEKVHPYKCFYCDVKFHRKSRRRDHVYRKHAAELKANPVSEYELHGRSYPYWK